MSQYALRLPDSLFDFAKKIAKKDHTSLNQLFVTAIAEKLSALGTEELLSARAQIADEKAYYAVLGKVSNTPPKEEDDKIIP